MVTMGFWRSESGNYHEGDAQAGDVAVSRRPSPQHDWDGEAWAVPLSALAAEKVAAIDAERDRLLKAGKLYAGKHVALLDKKGTDGPRADLSGMATNAIGVLIELPGLSWPQ